MAGFILDLAVMESARMCGSDAAWTEQAAASSSLAAMCKSDGIVVFFFLSMGRTSRATMRLLSKPSSPSHYTRQATVMKKVW